MNTLLSLLSFILHQMLIILLPSFNSVLSGNYRAASRQFKVCAPRTVNCAWTYKNKKETKTKKTLGYTDNIGPSFASYWKKRLLTFYFTFNNLMSLRYNTYYEFQPCVIEKKMYNHDSDRALIKFQVITRCTHGLLNFSFNARNFAVNFVSVSCQEMAMLYLI